MDTSKYKSKSIYVEHINKANKLGMTMNEYISTLATLAEQEKTYEQKQEAHKLDSLVGTVASLAEALRHQRFLTDSQYRKIEKQGELIDKLINAFSADIEFIQALKKEITK